MHIAGRLERRALALAVSAAVGSACSSTDLTYYGPPGGLTGKKLPSPTETASSEGGGMDGGGEGSSGSSAVAPEAGTSACDASWATQIFPNTTASGHWKCADPSSCHGGLQAPMMTSDPIATYKALAAYTMQFAPSVLPYVLPGSTDATKSGIVCNLAGTDCGPQMPLPGVVDGTAALTAQEISTLTTWVGCGAPNN